jgi:hypothetical protein
MIIMSFVRDVSEEEVCYVPEGRFSRMPEEISLKIPADFPILPRGQAGTSGNGRFFFKL